MIVAQYEVLKLRYIGSFFRCNLGRSRGGGRAKGRGGGGDRFRLMFVIRSNCLIKRDHYTTCVVVVYSKCGALFQQLVFLCGNQTTKIISVGNSSKMW